VSKFIEELVVPVKLGEYRNEWYRPGASAFARAAWFFLGLPLLRSAWLPSSAVRVWLLRRFGARVGRGCVIKPGVRVKYPWRLRMGDYCWLGEDCWIDNLAPVGLGDNVCISQGAYLCTGNHRWDDPRFALIVQPIRLGSGAWAGAKSVLCPGVSVGRCGIVCAGAVAMRTVPAYEIHGGNPARFLRIRRFPSSTPSLEENTSCNELSLQA
jgi:putative colanic acid biosynthesis acetyltransferase WcaF